MQLPQFTGLLVFLVQSTRFFNGIWVDEYNSIQPDRLIQLFYALEVGTYQLLSSITPF